MTGRHCILDTGNGYKYVMLYLGLNVNKTY